MLIRLGYDIRFQIPVQVPVIAMLNVHPSRRHDLREPDQLSLEPNLPVDEYTDSFGNICSRFVAPVGDLRLYSSSLIEDSGLPDEVSYEAREVPVGELPTNALRHLLASRYCETELLADKATELFGNLQRGGCACMPFAILSTSTLRSATTLPDRLKPRWTF